MNVKQQVKRAPEGGGLTGHGVTATRRRALLTAGVSAPGLLSAAGCLPASGGPPAAARSAVTLEYMTALNARQEGNHQQLVIEPFQQSHAPLRLSIVPRESGFTKLTSLVAAGTPPDVVWFFGPEVYVGNLVREVTDYVRRDRYNVGIFPKASFETSATWKGRILGLPNQSGGDCPVLAYNLDLFRQSGVTPPPARWGDPAWNAARWLEALQRTTRQGPDGKSASFGINSLGSGLFALDWPGLWNAAWLADDLKTVVCDSPQMIEATEFLAGLSARHKVMAGAAQLSEAFGDPDARKAFLGGKLAMYATSGGGTFAVAQAVQEQGLPLAYAPLPAFKTVGSAQNVDSNGIPVGAKHPEESWAFVKWSADTPNWAISRGNAPARADHFDAWSRELYPGDMAKRMHLDVYRESLRHAGKIDPLWKLPTFRQILTEIITPAYNRLVAGEASVATTLREVKAPVQALVPAGLPA